MKRGRLPLTALRSFESAGRHLSFSRAAEELFVSQAAISRQIRDLEVTLKAALFDRLHRKVVLTEAGHHLLRQLTSSFDAIDAALSEITTNAGASGVTVSVEPSIASEWLIPRLDRFRQLHPDIDILIDAEPRVIDFHADKADLAVRYSATKTSWPGTDAEKLISVFDTPMLSPGLLKSGPELSSPDDLRGYLLLHEETRHYWDRWFKAAGGHESPTIARGPLMTDMSLVLQAARRGHGVALGCLFLAHDDLENGALIRPFVTKIPSGACWLVARDLKALSEPAERVADWLRSEFATSRAAMAEVSAAA
jgi:LysR family transcriptional regulator, glycine cleavage system transcriptional activator